jgi:hypothetical protein
MYTVQTVIHVGLMGWNGTVPCSLRQYNCTVVLSTIVLGVSRNVDFMTISSVAVGSGFFSYSVLIDEVACLNGARPTSVSSIF